MGLKRFCLTGQEGGGRNGGRTGTGALLRVQHQGEIVLLPCGLFLSRITQIPPCSDVSGLVQLRRPFKFPEGGLIFLLLDTQFDHRICVCGVVLPALTGRTTVRVPIYLVSCVQQIQLSAWLELEAYLFFQWP